MRIRESSIRAFLCLILALILSFSSGRHSYSKREFEGDNNLANLEKYRRQLNHAHGYGHIEPGNSNLVHNLTVFGAIIVADPPPGVAAKSSNRSRNHDKNSLSLARYNNALEVGESLPFSLVHWPPVFTTSCPQYPRGHKTERGLALAHYQIWLDFVFFDNDVLEARTRKPPEFLSGTHYSSTSGEFVAYSNGTLYKNGVEFKEEDIMVIFEDDAMNAITDLNTTIVEELSDMKSIDLLFLGWCEGRLARPVPLCTHAYAVTRRGARKLIRFYEPCGKALDEQFVIMAKNNWIRYRAAHPYSYSKNLKHEFQGRRDATKGIFRQNKSLGSMNGH